MDFRIFYSWQSDLPGNVNRNFILEALERAVEVLRRDDTIEVIPRLDRDTAGVAGAPDIVQTILSKIEQADVFVCDVSLINPDTAKRKTPNPNVLVELGYAMGKLGLQRVIMVMNTAYGGPDDLPFDLRTKRQMTYALLPKEEKAPIRTALVRQLTEALRMILTEISVKDIPLAIPPLPELLQTAIINQQQNQSAIARRFMQWCVDELVRVAPDFSQQEDNDILLVQALEASIPLVIAFAKVADSVAEHNAVDAAQAIYKGFELLLAKYNLPPGFSGSYNTTDFDFYKFVGHELFVTLFSFLIRDNRWDLIASLLDDSFFISTPYRVSGETVSFDYISQPVELLELQNRRLQTPWITYHGHLLNERHTQGELATLVPIQQFAEADYFLFLRDQIQEQEDEYIRWLAWSVLYMRQQPRYIVDAVRAKNAQRLLAALGVQDILTLRERLGKRAPKIQKLFQSGFWRTPLYNFDWNSIGSK